IPREQQVYRAETELALDMLQQAQARRMLAAAWVTGDDSFGKSPSFRDGVAALGLLYVLEVPGDTPVWPVETRWESPPYEGAGRPRAALLLLECPSGHALGDFGAGGGGALADRDGVRDREERCGAGRI